MSAQMVSSAQSRAELEELYEREVATVHGFLLARCGNATLAEDLTTEVFINAATRFAQGRSAEVSTGWLITVARRRLVDHWRRSDTQRRGIEVLKRERAPLGETDEDGRVLAALDSLAPRQRAALVLRYLDDHSVSEVADALGVDYRAAESLLARGRRAFERAYEEQS
ncbi:MAG: RNA polymerase sigma factor [Actinomycetota bacterium]